MRISDWSSDVCSSDLGLSGVLPLPPQATLWHAHEMLFGFAAALIAGFALTAVENWTHAKSVSPGALAALTVLWVTARLSGLLPTPGGPLFAAAVVCLRSAEGPVGKGCGSPVRYCWRTYH